MAHLFEKKKLAVIAEIQVVEIPGLYPVAQACVRHKYHVALAGVVAEYIVVCQHVGAYPQVFLGKRITRCQE